MRDRVAISLANWILRHIATKHTAMFIAGAIEYGMRSAYRDERAGQAAPPHWFSTTTSTAGGAATVTYPHRGQA